jgi:hypothetical protein
MVSTTCCARVMNPGYPLMPNSHSAPGCRRPSETQRPTSQGSARHCRATGRLRCTNARCVQECCLTYSSAASAIKLAYSGLRRLNRAGDRNANSALWTIVMVRLRSRHAPDRRLRPTTRRRRPLETRRDPLSQTLRRTRGLPRHPSHHRVPHTTTSTRHRRLTPRGAFSSGVV